MGAGEQLAATLPDETEAIPGQTMIQETQDIIGDALGFFTTFLLVFAGVGVVVAAFTIYNTFQIVVSQRWREMALMRSIGATRRQVMSTQMLEALLQHHSRGEGRPRYQPSAPRLGPQAGGLPRPGHGRGRRRAALPPTHHPLVGGAGGWCR